MLVLFIYIDIDVFFFNWAFSYTVWISFYLASCFLGCFPVMEFFLINSSIKALLGMAIHCQVLFSSLSFAKCFKDFVLNTSQNKVSYMKFCLSLFCKSLMDFIQRASSKQSYWLSCCLKSSLLFFSLHVPPKILSVHSENSNEPLIWLPH